MSENGKYLVHLNTYLCEGALEVFNRKSTKFMSFYAFCSHYAMLIRTGELTERELRVLAEIYEYVNPILSLTHEKFMKHTYDFMSLKAEDIVIFEKIVMINKNFSMS